MNSSKKSIQPESVKLNLIIRPASPTLASNLMSDEPEKPVPPTPVSPVEAPLEAPPDNFRKGTIIKYFPQSGYGFVRDDNHREIYFHLDELRFVGEKNDRRYVTEGAHVGVDVSRTSRGLRVTKLKIY